MKISSILSKSRIFVKYNNNNNNNNNNNKSIRYFSLFSGQDLSYNVCLFESLVSTTILLPQLAFWTENTVTNPYGAGLALN